jgi:hypothetical protein
MTLSLASLVPVCVGGSMSPGWSEEPAKLLDEIMERYARLLLERAELACRQAREDGNQARARGIQ